jgi:Flp pilus assembly protein TadB
MAPLHANSWHLRRARQSGDQRRNGWRIAACCAPGLVGAVTMTVIHRGGVVFLILFASCTLLLGFLMAATS